VVQDALLNAGIALEQNNQAQFQTITDPTTGQPFTYTQTAGGFKLSSALRPSSGKPVTMDFGAPPGQ
jgi:hypothetical protein